MVNHGDAIGSDEWRLLPTDDQMSWRVPISVMLNMTLLRNIHPVITVSEYLQLHNLSADVEESNGRWERNKYHINPYIFDDTHQTPSLHVIENAWYDSWSINRIDKIPEDMKKRGGWNAEGGDPLKGEKGQWGDTPITSLYVTLQNALPTRPKVLEWDRTCQILRENGRTAESDDDVERILNENGWEVLYTYQGALVFSFLRGLLFLSTSNSPRQAIHRLGMEYIKNVVTPIRQVAPRDTLRGFEEDYGHLSADVVLLAGEIHYERKPVSYDSAPLDITRHLQDEQASLRFTSVPRRDLFSRLVLYHVHPIDKVYELAEKLASRVKELTGGRMWLGAHMRRGDCTCRTQAVLSLMLLLTFLLLYSHPKQLGNGKDTAGPSHPNTEPPCHGSHSPALAAHRRAYTIRYPQRHSRSHLHTVPAPSRQ
jgi:hypothetical protein